MSKSILLSDDGICDACPACNMRTDEQENLRCEVKDCLVHPDFKKVAKASVHHAIDYLNEPCTNRSHFPHIISLTNAWTMMPNGTAIRHRYYCAICMAEIEKEIGK
jgi:hypothetical protein